VTQMADQQSLLSSGDDPNLVEYQAISPLAIASLLLGTASPLALIASPLWVIPIAGVATAAVALARISATPALVGRRAALIGLMLSLLFGCAAPAKSLSRRWILHREAHQVAVHWFGLVTGGKRVEAHHWTLTPRTRRGSASAMQNAFENSEELQEQMTSFFAKHPVSSLVDAGDQVELYWLARVETSGDDKSDYVVQDYVFTLPSNRDVPVRVVLQRVRNEQSRRVDWRVVNVETPTDDEEDG